MELTLKNIVLMEPVASKLLYYEWATPKLSYDVFKLSEFVMTQVRFFNAERAKLFQKYGEKSGENVKIKAENETQFQNEINGLISMKIPAPDLHITLDDILNVKYIDSTELSEPHEKLTPMDMCRLEAFFNDMQAEQSDTSNEVVVGHIEADE